MSYLKQIHEKQMLYFGQVLDIMETMERRTGSQDSGSGLDAADKGSEGATASETAATTGLLGMGSQTR